MFKRLNATKAAITAGYSAKTAQEQSSRLLSNVMISESIQVFMSEATEKALVTIDDVVNGLLTEAQCNGEGSSQSARVSAWKALGDYTGGFDKSVSKVDHSSKDGSMSPAFDSGKYKDAQDKLKDLD